MSNAGFSNAWNTGVRGHKQGHELCLGHFNDIARLERVVLRRNEHVRVAARVTPQIEPHGCLAGGHCAGRSLVAAADETEL